MEDAVEAEYDAYAEYDNMRRRRWMRTTILSAGSTCSDTGSSKDRAAILALRAASKLARDSKIASAYMHAMRVNKCCRIGEAKKPGPRTDRVVKIEGDGHCAYRAMAWHLGITHQEVRQGIIRQAPGMWQSIREDDQNGCELEAFMHETEHEIWGGYAQIHVAAHIWNVCFEVRFGNIVHRFGNGRRCGLRYKAKGAKDPGAHYDVIVIQGDDVGPGRFREGSDTSSYEKQELNENCINKDVQEYGDTHREWSIPKGPDTETGQNGSIRAMAHHKGGDVQERQRKKLIQSNPGKEQQRNVQKEENILNSTTSAFDESTKGKGQYDDTQATNEWREYNMKETGERKGAKAAIMDTTTAHRLTGSQWRRCKINSNKE